MNKKKYSLKKGYEIKKTIRKGKWKSEKRVIVYVYANKLDYNRTAICVSKKNGKSVKRNYLKRIVRQAHRSVIKDINVSGYDFVIMLKKDSNIDNTNYKNILYDLEHSYCEIFKNKV